MTRLVPHPLLSAGLVLMWLLLNRFSLGHLVLGSVVALIAGRAMAALVPVRPRIRHWGTVARLFRTVMVDIVRSNIAVARLIVAGRRGGARRSGFVGIDLELRDPTALAVLAVIVTATPGTAWLDYDATTGRLLLHVFDLISEDEWRAIVNDRYGRMLKEIFE
jgi:multicomponent K+:H+ antiporter subunit E